MDRFFVFLVLTVFVLGCTNTGVRLNETQPAAAVSSTEPQFNLSLIIKNPRKCAALNGWTWYTTPWNKSICLPSTLESCLMYDGFWGTIGNSTASVCNMRALDFGRFCKDSSQCHGECIAQLSIDSWKMLALYQNQSVAANGTCSEYAIALGPVSEVKSGKVYSIVTYV